MVAYNLMLAVFPFALLVLFVFGQVLKIDGVETSVLNDLQRLFPNTEQHTLTDVLNRIQDNSTTIGIAAFVGSLWIGASFWGAMDTAFCRIYHVECRGWVEQKRFSFAMLGVVLALHRRQHLRADARERHRHQHRPAAVRALRHQGDRHGPAARRGAADHLRDLRGDLLGGAERAHALAGGLAGSALRHVRAPGSPTGSSRSTSPTSPASPTSARPSASSSSPCSGSTCSASRCWPAR